MEISVWEKDSYYAPKDFIIVGGGFTGLWSAYFLRKKFPNASITILERSAIPTGASTRNAGFACFGSLSELLRDHETMGEDAMLSLVEQRYKGLERIQQLFSLNSIEYDPCGGYELINPNQPLAGSEPELEDKVIFINNLIRSITDKKNTFRIRDRKISVFGFNGVQHLIQNKLEGCLHPGKLSLALQMEVQRLGILFIPSQSVTGYSASDNGVELYTESGLQFHAAKVLICTNGFAQQLLPDLDVTPARGQMLLTSPIDHLSFSGAFHFDEGFYYFRNLGNRVLLGGARNKAFETEQTTNMETTDLIQNTLESFLREQIIPGAEFTITNRWSGIMGLGSAKSPIIKEADKNLYCALRLGGMGVALAPLIGEKAAKMMA